MTFLRLFIAICLIWLMPPGAGAGVVSLAMADGQTAIGDQFAEGANGGEGSFGHIVSHAVVGCAAGELMGGDCGASAAAAATSAFMAGIVDSSELEIEDKQALQNEAELFAGLAGALASGGDSQATQVAANVGGSAFQNNYLNHAQREEADKLLDHLEEAIDGCVASHGYDVASCNRANEIGKELTELQIASAENTLAMLEICGAGQSQACTDHLTQAQQYQDWSNGFFNQRDGWFDVDASQAFDVDWGGDLDAFVLQETEGVTTDAGMINAIAGVESQSILYDGRMNLAVGTGTVALAGLGCAVTSGLGCAVLVGGAVLAEANNIYDGAATVITGEATDGLIQQAFEASGMDPADARQYEQWVELGLAVATLSADGMLLVTTRSGTLLGRADDVGDLLAPNRGAFDDLAQFRDELGLPPAGSATDRSTLAVVEVNGQQIYGINGHGQPVTGVNAISRTHAEIDALNQIQQRGIDVSGQNLTLHVDRTPCTACNQNGGIRTMVEQLGLNQLTVIGPDGPLIIRPR